MKPPVITLAQLEPLPIVYRLTAPERFRDLNGHMNMRYYLELYDEAGIPLFELFGLTEAYYRSKGAGGFDLEHHIHYLNEVHIGDDLLVRARLVGRSAKRLHYMLFMVNASRDLLASTFECVNSYADLTVRRTAPFPVEITEQIDVMLAAHTALDWTAPVCGVMGA